MMPDILEHIVEDVQIDEIHQKIEEYKGKLSTFETSTKLKDVINTHFPVPDYCIELTFEVEGWEDKTIKEAERSVANILGRATCTNKVGVGWKKTLSGSMKLTFILTELIWIDSKKLPRYCVYNGVLSIKCDGELLYSKHSMKLDANLESGAIIPPAPASIVGKKMASEQSVSPS